MSLRDDTDLSQAYQLTMESFDQTSKDSQEAWKLLVEPGKKLEDPPTQAWLARFGLIASATDLAQTEKGPIHIFIQNLHDKKTMGLTYEKATDTFVFTRSKPAITQTPGFLFQKNGSWVISTAAPDLTDLSGAIERPIIPNKGMLFRYSENHVINVEGLPLPDGSLEDIARGISQHKYAQINGTDHVHYFVIPVTLPIIATPQLGNTSINQLGYRLTKNVHVGPNQTMLLDDVEEGGIALIPAKGVFAEATLRGLDPYQLNILLSSIISSEVFKEKSGSQGVIGLTDKTHLGQFFTDHLDGQVWSGDSITDPASLQKAVDTGSFQSGQVLVVPNKLVRAISLNKDTYVIIEETTDKLFSDNDFKLALPSGLSFVDYLKFNLPIRLQEKVTASIPVATELTALSPTFFYEQIIDDQDSWQYLSAQLRIESNNIDTAVASMIANPADAQSLHRFVFDYDKEIRVGYLLLRKNHNVLTATITNPLYQDWGSEFPKEIAKITNMTDQLSAADKTKWINSSLELSIPSSTYGMMKVGEPGMSLHTILSLATNQMESLSNTETERLTAELTKSHKVKLNGTQILVGDPAHPEEGFYLSTSEDLVQFLNTITINSNVIDMCRAASANIEAEVVLTGDYHSKSKTDIRNYLSSYGFNISEDDIDKIINGGTGYTNSVVILLTDDQGLTGAVRQIMLNQQENEYVLSIFDSTKNFEAFFSLQDEKFLITLRKDQLPSDSVLENPKESGKGS